MRTLDKAALITLGGVLAYVAFQWGGAVPTGRYEYLLLLGLLAMILSLGRAREEWAPLPGGVVRWTLALLPAYVLMQVVPLPVSLVRVLSPARAEGVAALDLIGAKVNFAERFSRHDLPVLPARLRVRHHLPACARVDMAL
jgi:hypothetical protein